MISHEKKCIFIHIPKCAGSSIEFFLKQEVNALGWNKEEGLEYKMRREGLAKVINLYPHYFTFTFVRNPFARFVSIWKYSERMKGYAKQRQNHYGYRPQENLSLKEYANLIKAGDLQQLSGFDTYHTRKQVDFILDFNKETLFGIPRKTQDNCNFIGRLESLNDDFKVLCQLLDIKYQTLSHQRNSKRPKHYSEYYDDETVEIIGELYSEDIEFLGYKFTTETIE